MDTPTRTTAQNHRAPTEVAALKDEMIRLVSSGFTATRAAKSLGLALRTLNDWKHCDPTFATAWRHARIEQSLALADEILDISDEPVADMAAAQRQRTRIDSRKWFCSKLAPKLFGDKIRLNVETEPPTQGVVILPALDWDQPVINANAVCVVGELPNRAGLPLLPRATRGE